MQHKQNPEPAQSDEHSGDADNDLRRALAELDALRERHLLAAKKALANRDLDLAEKQKARAATFVAVLDRIALLESVQHPLPLYRGEDISDLPESLRKELSGTHQETIDDQIIETIAATAQNACDIDTLLVGLYRRHKVEQTRKYLQNRLWRMARKGLLAAVSGKKGWYQVAGVATTPIATSVLEDMQADRAARPETLELDADMCA